LVRAAKATFVSDHGDETVFKSPNNTIESCQPTFRQRLWMLLAVAFPLLCVFWPVLTSQQNFVYRDAGHYYFPLYRYLADQWNQGRIPLWNPYDNLGQPLLANPTSAVLYPGKLLFALPFSHDTNFNLYILGHVCLATGSCFLCARRWGVGFHGAVFAALAYTMSGSVLFQYCNVVFLVGASWLPFAFLAIERLFRCNGAGAAVLLGSVLAMMTLGGDPQSAYHAGFAAVVYALILLHRDWQSRHFASGSKPSFWRSQELIICCRRCGLIIAAGLVGGLLAAVQILPSWFWVRQSDREFCERPRSVWEIPGHVVCRHDTVSAGTLAHEILSGLVGPTESGTHDEFTYRFSNAPWRFMELVWPNVGGRQFPTHRRWFNLIPAEGRVWTPSLYVGLLPLLMAGCTWRKRRRSPGNQWLWALVAIFAAGSLGRYGIGWLLQELAYVSGGDGPLQSSIGDPVGGIYWMMVTFLPGYSLFRYPAKLFVVATLALCLLSGHGWEQSNRNHHYVLRRGLLWLGRVTLAVLVLSMTALLLFRDRTVQTLQTDELFGPFYQHLSKVDFVGALLHGLVLCWIYRWVLKVADSDLKPACEVSGSKRKRHVPARLVPCVVLLVTGLELVVAHAWMVQCAPRSNWASLGCVVDTLAAQSGSKPGRLRLMRVPPSTRYPRWDDPQTGDRLSQALAWDRDTLYPNFHLSARQRLIQVPGTMQSYTWREMFIQSQRVTGLKCSYDASFLEALGVSHCLIIQSDFGPAKDFRPLKLHGSLANSGEVSLRSSLRDPQRCWFVPVTAVDFYGPVDVSVQNVSQLAQRVLEHDLRQSAVVFNDAAPKWLMRDSKEISSEGTIAVEIVKDEPERVELQVELSEKGLVVLADQFEPGWKLLVESDASGVFRREPIQQTNLVMRGVFLPAGTHRLVFQYQPVEFFQGAVGSAVGWLGVGLFVFSQVFIGRDEKPTPQPPGCSWQHKVEQGDVGKMA